MKKFYVKPETQVISVNTEGVMYLVSRWIDPGDGPMPIDPDGTDEDIDADAKKNWGVDWGWVEDE